MNKKHDRLGILLACVVGIAMLTAMLVRAFLPRVILPKLNAETLILLSLTALVLDHYLVRGRRDFRLLPLYAALIFGLFPWLSCFALPLEALRTALLGTVIFILTTLIFDSITERLSSGPASKAAPLISAFGLFLATQCLAGIL